MVVRSRVGGGGDLYVDRRCLFPKSSTSAKEEGNLKEDCDEGGLCGKHKYFNESAYRA